MRVNWKEKRRPLKLIQKMRSYTVINDDGSISYLSWNFQADKAILAGMLNSKSNIPEIELRRAVSHGTSTAFKKSDFSPEGVLECINAELSAYSKRVDKNYYLFSQINLPRTWEVPAVRLEGRYLRFTTYFPNKVQLERNRLIRKEEMKFGSPYSIVRVRTKGRSSGEAADNAFYALNLLRGVWNLALNPPNELSFGKPKPINRIRLGEFQTLHNLDYSAAAPGEYWYEPDYYDGIYQTFDNDVVSKLLTKIKEYRKSISKSNYPEIIKKFIVRYVTALDLKSKNAAFISLFGLLESLTSTTKQNYDLTIKRASFLFPNREYAIEILEHLRTYRNEFIHEGNSRQNIESDLYLLKEFVEVLISFHIGYSGEFSNLDESGKFLSLPSSTEELKKKRKHLSLALNLFEDK